MAKLLKCGLQMRVGEGWDTHQLVEGRPLLLGGVKIPYDRGLLGHSDADALLHAITDALLGAIGKGDIGRAFPDTDALYKDADSAILLKTVYEQVLEQGWMLMNVDSTIIAQAPKLTPFMEEIVTNIANILQCELSQINVKAKTAEKLGPVGEGKSIEARAVCLLIKVDQKN